MYTAKDSSVESSARQYSVSQAPVYNCRILSPIIRYGTLIITIAAYLQPIVGLCNTALHRTGNLLLLDTYRDHFSGSGRPIGPLCVSV